MLNKTEKTWEDRLKEQDIDIRELCSIGVWVDGQDKLHKISEMDIEYIENCIEFLKKEGYENRKDGYVKLPEILKTLKDIYLRMFESELQERK